MLLSIAFLFKCRALLQVNMSKPTSCCTKRGQFESRSYVGLWKCKLLVTFSNRKLSFSEREQLFCKYCNLNSKLQICPSTYRGWVIRCCTFWKATQEWLRTKSKMTTWPVTVIYSNQSICLICPLTLLVALIPFLPYQHDHLDWASGKQKSTHLYKKQQTT